MKSLPRNSSGELRDKVLEESALAFTLAAGPMVLAAEEVDHDKDQRHVLPATARPHGYSPERMARLMAFLIPAAIILFTTYIRHFQILYSGGNQDNTFVVYARTMFFIPLFYVDEIPPLIGDFPTEPSMATEYFRDPKQLGAKIARSLWTDIALQWDPSSSRDQFCKNIRHR